MAKRGPHPKPPHLKAISNTSQPCHETAIAVEMPEGDAQLPDEFERLNQMRPQFAERVLAIWNSQVAKYRARGQDTAGCGRSLYQMCLLEADIHDRTERGADVPMAMRNGLRVYYGEFFDTPASNVKPAGARAGGRFAKYGNRPGS